MQEASTALGMNWGGATAVAAVILVACGGVCLAEQVLPLFPPALEQGDTIAVVAPAGVVDRERMERARRRIEEMGYRVRLPPDLYRRRGYLAGEDSVRADELMAAFRDPQVKAIFAATGGYGSTRILDQLDFTVIRNNPKILLGYSDITALQLAIQRKTGLVTFHGPLMMYAWGGQRPMSEFSRQYYWRAILATSYPLPAVPGAGGYVYEIPPPIGALQIVAPGMGRGRLTGGNLSLIAALMGTPYEIDTRDRVLFLEDVNEEPYRIDRYLSQLKLAGKLEVLAGVILGRFTGCEPKRGAGSLTLEQVFNDYFADLGVPVLANFPAGHHRDNATLPINAMIEVDANVGRVRVLENPVRLPD